MEIPSDGQAVGWADGQITLQYMPVPEEVRRVQTHPLFD